MLVAVAVSGGVDSLCALIMVLQAGYKAVALHGLFCENASVPSGLEKICANLGVPLHVIDMKAEFRQKVILPFARDNAAGMTPNPCALCNREIKFGAMLDVALALGADRLATGHYARLETGPDDTRLLVASAAGQKDQGYFLSLVPAERLHKVFFPLAYHDKRKSRALVSKAALDVPVAVESQDICFVPSGNGGREDFLLAFWQAQGEEPPASGPLVLVNENGEKQQVARHCGLWRYTEGQRKGLGIAYKEPLHVLGKDIASNTLLVGPKNLLGIRYCHTGKANVFLPPDLWPEKLLVRLRYRREAHPATVSLQAGCLHLVLDQLQFPAAPGQVASVCDESGRIFAAGIINKTGK